MCSGMVGLKVMLVAVALNEELENTYGSMNGIGINI